jgi:hypothetical protein
MKLANIGAAGALALGMQLSGPQGMALEHALRVIDVEDGLGAPLSKHGDVQLWNDSSRLVGATYQQALAGYTVGWSDSEDLVNVKEFIAPSVQVARRFEYKSFNNVEQFLSDTKEDLRAIGGKFKEVERFVNDQTGRTENRGLAMRIDKDQMMPGWEEQSVNFLLRRLQRNKLRRAFTLLSASATNTAKTWDTSAGKNPDQDVKTELITASDLTGVRPNAIVYGDTAFDKRSIAYGAQVTAAGFAAFATPGPGGNASVGGDLTSRLMVDKVMVSRARYSSSSTARTQIVNNLVLMFYSYAGAGPEDPTTLKDFWTPCDQGGRYAVYRIDSPKFVQLIVEHYELLAATSTLGVRQFTVS